MSQPVCTIIGGPNGAGKTTFAMNYLPQVEDCRNFINADSIALGLSPLSPERERIVASRLFLKEIEAFVIKRESFAFESTLSGKTYLRLIRRLLANNWKVNLYYLWLASIDMSFRRVGERVSHGGHDIPRELIIRRYPRSINNLLNDYAPLCHRTICLDNSQAEPKVIFVQDTKGRIIEDSALYKILSSTL